MANTVPMTTSHHGASGGKVRAISQAVTTAEPSDEEDGLNGLFWMRSMAVSASSAASVAMTSWTRMAGPTSQA